MSTLDQKRLLKLAGLLKEGMEEWPRGLAEEEEEVPKAKVGNLDVPMGYDVGEPEYKWEPSPDMSREEMESLYSDMYKELHNIRPRWVDFENLSDSELRQMLVNLQDDIENAPPLDDYEDYEDYEAEADKEAEAFKQSLYMQGEEEEEFLEPEASAEEEELERLPKQMGMGRGAGLDETYIDNMKEEVEEHAIVRGKVKTPAGMELLKALEAIEQRIMGKEAWEAAEAEALKRQAQSVVDTLELHKKGGLQEAIRAMVREVLLEKAKKYKGKSMRLGGGGRFAKFVDSLKKSGKSEEQARAIAYKAGAKKYGKEKMSKMASAGRKRKK